MIVTPGDQLVGRKPLRLWPGVLAVSLQWFLRFIVPFVFPETLMIGIIAGLAGTLIVLVWWLFFSRAPWSERLGAVVLIAAAMFGTSRVLDESIAKGAMGMLFPILAFPVVSLALVSWAVLTRHLSDTTRRAALVMAILVACGVWTLARTEGFTGNFENDLSWRWTATSEQRFLAKLSKQPPAIAPAPDTQPTEPRPAPSTPAQPAVATVPPVKPATTPTPADVVWGGFRGPHRDGAVSGTRIETDWSAFPPKKLWRREIGPGWSSFAVNGGRFYTQEQRGPEEVVSCYQLATGEPLWTHSDQARFWESNAGPGPRGTPTLGNGRVYALGATGILNALNADDGTVVWSRNAAAETNTKAPEWGFAGSPLLFENLLIVAVSGQLAAYDAATGAPRWSGPRAGTSYSSPHLVTSNGVSQVLLLGADGALSVSPEEGKVLWKYEWKGYPIVQPNVTGDGDVLISINERDGIQRLALAPGTTEWKLEERWRSTALKPYFNDFVVHKGHAFGFDGSILASIDLKDGSRKWKGGRYGHGQLVLLREQDLLLVLSEEGELALVKAKPDAYTEVARVPGIQGKTWNHPVIAGDVLLARNGEEMAAFRLSRAGR